MNRKPLLYFLQKQLILFQLLGGQFSLAQGGHIALANRGQFKPVEGDHFAWIFHIPKAPPQPAEIIDRPDLLQRLKITEPTLIRWVRRKRIPEIKIGASCRYEWNAVVKALQKPS